MLRVKYFSPRQSARSERRREHSGRGLGRHRSSKLVDGETKRRGRSLRRQRWVEKIGYAGDRPSPAGTVAKIIARLRCESPCVVEAGRRARSRLRLVATIRGRETLCAVAHFHLRLHFSGSGPRGPLFGKKPGYSTFRTWSGGAGEAGHVLAMPVDRGASRVRGGKLELERISEDDHGRFALRATNIRCRQRALAGGAAINGANRRQQQPKSFDEGYSVHVNGRAKEKASASARKCGITFDSGIMLGGRKGPPPTRLGGRRQAKLDPGGGCGSRKRLPPLQNGRLKRSSGRAWRPNGADRRRSGRRWMSQSMRRSYSFGHAPA